MCDDEFNFEVEDFKDYGVSWEIACLNVDLAIKVDEFNCAKKNLWLYLNDRVEFFNVLVRRKDDVWKLHKRILELAKSGVENENNK